MGVMGKTTLSELGDDEVYSSLQQKLEDVRDSKNDKRQDGIVSLLELTARVQGKLFEALNEEGVPDSKVVPLMATGNLGIPASRVSAGTELLLAKENLDKTRELEDVKFESDLQRKRLEAELAEKEAKARLAKSKQQAVEAELSRTKRSLELTKNDLNETLKDLSNTKTDNALLRTYPYSSLYPYHKYYPYYYWDKYYPSLARYRSYYPYYYDYLDRDYWLRKSERDYASLKTDLAVARIRADTDRQIALDTTRRLALTSGVADATNDVRRRRLIDRYADLFTTDRMRVQKQLRHETADEDVIKRVIYASVVESFRAAQRFFRDFRHRARRLCLSSSLLPTYESEVNDYIVTHRADFDNEGCVNEALRSIEIDGSLPIHINYRRILRNLVSQLVDIAFEMQTVDPSLDIDVGTRGEVFNESKFRRTFDAEFSAPLIQAHLWPPLVNSSDGSVVLKGEAATRHGLGPVSTRGRTRTKASKGTRSASPVRGKRTRTLSPVKRY